MVNYKNYSYLLGSIIQQYLDDFKSNILMTNMKCDVYIPDKDVAYLAASLVPDKDKGVLHQSDYEHSDTKSIYYFNSKGSIARIDVDLGNSTHSIKDYFYNTKEERFALSFDMLKYKDNILDSNFRTFYNVSRNDKGYITNISSVNSFNSSNMDFEYANNIRVVENLSKEIDRVVEKLDDKGRIITCATIYNEICPNYKALYNFKYDGDLLLNMTKVIYPRYGKDKSRVATTINIKYMESPEIEETGETVPLMYEIQYNNKKYIFKYL